MTGADVGRAYDGRAQEYVELFGSLDRQGAADRDLVARWRGATEGPLLDAGCGPGHWTAFVQEDGCTVVGLDVSERFLTHAREAHPEVPFVRGSIDALPFRDGSIGGVLAWYSLIHTHPAALPVAFAELRRVLGRGGSLLLGFVDGGPGQPFEHAVVRAYTWSVEGLGELLGDAGFRVGEHHHRRDEGHRPHAALVAHAVPARGCRG